MNKQYEAVLESSAVVYSGSGDLEWVQLYKGLARGLGGLNTDIALCAEDGNTTLETFRAALTAFEDREIFTGVACVFAECISVFERWEDGEGGRGGRGKERRERRKREREEGEKERKESSDGEGKERRERGRGKERREKGRGEGRRGVGRAGLEERNRNVLKMNYSF